MATFSQADWQLETTMTPIETTSFEPESDPEWEYVDVAGHTHRYAEEGPDHYPSLRYVVDSEDWMDDDGEEWPGESHYECPDCGEHVVPGIRPSRAWRTFIPGPRCHVVTAPDGYRFTITEGQYAELLDGVGDLTVEERNQQLEELRDATILADDTIDG